MNKVLDREKVEIGDATYQGKRVLAAAVVRTIKGWKAVLFVEGLSPVTRDGHRSASIAHSRVFDMLDSPFTSVFEGGSHGA